MCSVVDIPFIDSPQSEPELVLFREGALGQPVKEEVGDSGREGVENQDRMVA